MQTEHESRFARLLDETKEVLAPGKSLSSVGPSILKHLSLALDCQFAIYWQVEGPILRAIFCWQHSSIDAGPLRNDFRFRTLEASQGTAAHVRRSGKPVWTHDLSRDMCAARSVEALQSGLNAGIWIPLKVNGEVISVVELLSHELPAASWVDRLSQLEWFGEMLGKQLADSLQLFHEPN